MKEFIATKTEKLSKSCLTNVAGISYNVLMHLIKDKDVKINDKRVGKDQTVNVGDKITIYYNEREKELFSIIFQDENVIIINKKKGYTSEEVFENIKAKYTTACFIHRLDRNTDGIMIFALNSIAERELLFGFKNHTFIKEYVAEVFGKMEKKEDILTAFLKKDSEKGEVKIFDKKVDGAVLIKTGYKVIEEKEKTSVLLVTLYTGKTHQIRGHLAHIGHFVVGDSRYGNDEFNKKYGYKTQQLSSHKLTLLFKNDSPLYYLNNRTCEI